VYDDARLRKYAEHCACGSSKHAPSEPIHDIELELGSDQRTALALDAASNGRVHSRQGRCRGPRRTRRQHLLLGSKTRPSVGYGQPPRIASSSTSASPVSWRWRPGHTRSSPRASKRRGKSPVPHSDQLPVKQRARCQLALKWAFLSRTQLHMQHSE
jgi:hypothetical protein